MSDERLNYYIAPISRHPRVSETSPKEALVTGNMRLVVHLAKKWGMHDTDAFLDRVQDGYVGLIKAAAAYNPERGKFSTVAAYYIRAEIRQNTRDKFGNLLGTAKYSTSILFEDSEEQAEDLTDMDSVDAENALERAQNTVTEKQWKVVLGRALGKTQKELAAEMGTTYQAVQQIEINAAKTLQGLKEAFL